MSKKLHIVSFDIPYPPNYGGVIDVYYKLKSLSELGVEITLHTFEYNRTRAEDELMKYCKKVYYYPRNSIFKSLLSSLPFVVKSRQNDLLIANLQKDIYPILFEGIHTTYPLYSMDFSDRNVLIRMHNIEHFYYKGLAKSEQNPFKKTFFKTESKKLAKYEKVLHKADFVLPISPYETAYYKKLCADKAKVIYVPPFHENTSVSQLCKKGKIAFYHGDLRISDNIRAVHFLIDVFIDLPYALFIGAGVLPKEIREKIKGISNIYFIDISKKGVLQEYFTKSHINILPSFQKTGIKLKLINALYQSRFVVGNDAILLDTGLDTVCFSANNKVAMQTLIKELINTDYTEADIRAKEIALASFNVLNNAEKILNLL